MTRLKLPVLSLHIAYKEGYKYQLAETFIIWIRVVPDENIETKYISLSTSGVLRVWAGYAWDGPSGPTWDTKNFMRGALVHDALYQLMREGHLGQDQRRVADKELWRICRQDGMSAIRAWYVYHAVRIGARWAASPEAKRKIHYAP